MERNVGCFVAHAFGNRESCETLVDEQAHMAVAQIVRRIFLTPLFWQPFFIARDIWYLVTGNMRSLGPISGWRLR